MSDSKSSGKGEPLTEKKSYESGVVVNAGFLDRICMPLRGR